MAYEKQNFKSGDKLYASQLNAMDDELKRLSDESENSNGNGSGVTIDTTFSESGKAADAKLTGDLLGIAPGASKNLNTTRYKTKTTGGVTFTVNDDNSVSLSGSATEEVWALTYSENHNTRFLLPAGTYHLSGSYNSNARGYLVVYDENENSKSYIDTGDGLTVTLEQDRWCYVQLCVRPAAGTVDGITLRMQLEKGEHATEYVSPFAAGVRSARLDNAEEMIAALDRRVNPFVVPDYYFANGYLYGRVSAIKEQMKSSVGNGDAFIFITDAHWAQNAGNSPALIHLISENLNITKVVSGGDTGNTDGGAGFCDALRKCFPGRVYHVFGNHEYFYPADASLLAYNTIMYNDDVHTGVPDRNYYYFDNHRAHIRYIVLDSYSPGTESNTAAQPGYEETQLAWLTDTALDVPDGWGIVIFTHHMYYINLDTMALQAPRPGGQAVLDALDAYNANESSKGEVICVVQGHNHHDRITHSTGGIPVIITACDKYQPWIDGDTNKEPWLSTRVAGTITEQAFDIVVVDRDARELYFFRIGGDAFNGIDNDPGEPVNLRTVSY